MSIYHLQAVIVSDHSLLPLWTAKKYTILTT